MDSRICQEYVNSYSFFSGFAGDSSAGASETIFRINSLGRIAVSTALLFLCSIFMLSIARLKSGSGFCPEAETSAD
jgi:hypothetical protein